MLLFGTVLRQNRTYWNKCLAIRERNPEILRERVTAELLGI